MALITCAECGKENISDSAATCPSCGYGIKEHFERIEQEKAFIEQKQQSQENLQRALEAKLKEIDNMPHPYKSSLTSIISEYNDWPVLLFGFAAMLLLLCGVIFLFTGDGSGIGAGFFCFLICAPFSALTYVFWKSIEKNYDNAMNKYRNWDSYKERLKKDATNYYEAQITDLKKQKFVARQDTVSPERVIMLQPSTGLKCPACGSPRIKKISTMSRAVSVELVGLASSKIGKQYECQNCKHKW